MKSIKETDVGGDGLGGGGAAVQDENGNLAEGRGDRDPESGHWLSEQRCDNIIMKSTTTAASSFAVDSERMHKLYPVFSSW